MDEVICDDIVSVIVELTPDVEIKLDGLGHVLKNGFDLYNLDFRYLDFLPLTTNINFVILNYKRNHPSMKILHLIKSTFFNPRFFATSRKQPFTSM
jgi:hypothetical protein